MTGCKYDLISYNDCDKTRHVIIQNHKNMIKIYSNNKKL